MRARLALLLIGVLLPLAQARGEAPLRLCALVNDPPRSQQSGNTGLDLDLARAVAERIGASLEVLWVPNAPRIVELEDSDLPLGRLARGRCDLVGSVPGEETLGPFADRVILTDPYYGMGFELIGAPPQELTALRGTTVAVQLQSVAHYALQQLGIEWYARVNSAQVLSSLDDGTAGAALVWGPDLGPLGRAYSEDFVPPEALRWNAHLAVRRGEARFDAVRAAVADLLEDGTVDALLQRYGVPRRAPFATVSSPAARRALGGAGG